MAVVVSSSFLLSACVTTQAGRIGIDDGTDVCRANLVALDATGDYFAESMLTGMLTGAVTGALTGALVSKDAAKGAAIGALTGAAAGAAGGYIYSKMQQEKDKAVLYQSVMSDYDRELAKIDEADLAFKKLTDCRNQAMAQVVADYNAKRISREEATVRWRTLVDRKAKDIEIADAMGKHMSEHLSQFDDASQKIGALPWSDAQEAELKKQTDELRAKQVAENDDIEKKKTAARKAHNKKKIQEYDDLRKQKDADHSAELAALRVKATATVPTTTAQVRIQSYKAAVETASADQKKQAAMASNPDGFESALPAAAKTSLVIQPRYLASAECRSSL